MNLFVSLPPFCCVPLQVHCGSSYLQIILNLVDCEIVVAVVVPDFGMVAIKSWELHLG
jgi:hypothetical protein